MNRSPELTPDLVELICAENICLEVTLSIYSKPHVEEKDEHIPSIVSCFLRCSVSSVAGALSRCHGGRRAVEWRAGNIQGDPREEALRVPVTLKFKLILRRILFVTLTNFLRKTSSAGQLFSAVSKPIFTTKYSLGTNGTRLTHVDACHTLMLSLFLLNALRKTFFFFFSFLFLSYSSLLVRKNIP